MKTTQKAQPVQSLTRALDILEFAARHEEGVSLSDIAELLDVSQGAAFNLSNTLVSRGYLNKSARPVRFTIGDKLIDLGLRQAESQRIQGIAEVMTQLTAQFPTINTLFVVPSTYQIICSLRTDPTQPGVIQRPMRTLDNPYSMITPITLLAFMDEESRNRIFQRYPFEEFASRDYPDIQSFRQTLRNAQEQGHSYKVEGKPRLAYPVYDHNGQLFGCLGVSLLGPDSSIQELDKIQQVLEEQLLKPFSHPSSKRQAIAHS